jgi:lysyl-tRNA synthetase class 2
MAMLESMVESVALQVRGTTDVEIEGQMVRLAAPWRRLALRDALIEYAGLDIDEYRDIERLQTWMLEHHVEPEPGAGWGKLIDQVQSEFVEPKLVQPTFLTDYPIELSPLAKQRPDDPRIVERFEAFVTGFEIANAYSELNDPLEQAARFREQAALREAGDDEAESIRRGLHQRPGARHASDRRPRRGHRPPRHAAVEPPLDPGGHPLPHAP